MHFKHPRHGSSRRLWHLLWLCCLTALCGCEPPWTIADFHTRFAADCRNELAIRTLDAREAEAVCACMTTEARRRWQSLDELNASLIKEDRPPRGPVDFLRGAARVTYQACKRQ